MLTVFSNICFRGECSEAPLCGASSTRAMDRDLRQPLLTRNLGVDLTFSQHNLKSSSVPKLEASGLKKRRCSSAKIWIKVFSAALLIPLVAYLATTLLISYSIEMGRRDTSVMYDNSTNTFNINKGLRSVGSRGILPQREDPTVVVWGRYLDLFKDSGWYKLEISVNRRAPYLDTIKARAAGYLEAYYQHEQIYNYWYNYRMNEFRNTSGRPPSSLVDYVQQQNDFIRNNIRDNEGNRYWELMALVMAQFDGLCEGYWRYTSPERNLTWVDLYLLNSVGDLYDLNVVYHYDDEGDNLPASAKERRFTVGHGIMGEGGPGDGLECSALLKLYRPKGLPREVVGLDGNGDDAPTNYNPFMMWAGHATWRPYYAMVRTWKVYDFPWGSSGPLMVSSSPGLLHSKDDWYTTDRLLVMETTNAIYNKDLYDLIGPSCALTWQRVQVANFGATSGAEWVQLFSSHNSGTYNNQFMIFDVNQFKKSAQRTDVLWVVEQLPGVMESADVSHVLYQKGYWASFNVPYFNRIYNLSGYPLPNVYSTNPRAQIFAREQQRIRSQEDIRHLMRLNKYQHDSLSKGLPSNAIAARYDLPATCKSCNWTRKAFGSVDAKVIGLKGFKARATDAISGPSTDQQRPFKWPAPASNNEGSSTMQGGFGKKLPYGEDDGQAQTAFGDVAHEGCADAYDFPWMTFTATLCRSVHTC